MKRVRALGPVFIVLLAPRALLAAEQPPPSAPVTRTTQQLDPDVPPRPARRPSSTLPPATVTGPDEGLLIAGELLVGSATIAGLGVAGFYAISYAPPSSDGLPRSTAGSTALNLGGVAALLAGPAIAGWLVCAIGRLSVSYEGGCGVTIGFAAAGGLTLALVADQLTTRAPPAGCDECAATHSGVATLIGYVAGVALGAVITWNLSKHKKEDSLALQPMTRAGPPPAALADWTAPLLRSADRASMGNDGRAVPLIAFAF